jgi:uncharacterized protein YndB with AHSA1/START domain
MIRILTVFAFAVASAMPAFAEVATCSRTEPSGERTLCHEAVIAAPAHEAWALFSTSEGLRTWLAPVVAIDLRAGGAFETSYEADRPIGDARNIRNRVVAVAPESLLVIQVTQAPPGFAHADEVRELTTAIAFEPVDAAHTRVRVSMLGYREGAPFDELYRFFDAGNAWTLNKLAERAERGPVDWTQER